MDRKQYVINEPILEGANILLEGLCERHVSSKYADWLNDKEVCKENSHGGVFNSLDMTRDYVRKVDESETIAVFAIIARDTGQHIGNISLGNISWSNNSAEISILIGEKKYWGKGVAKEAYSLVISYGFGTLNLHRLYSGMTVRNKAMQKVAERSGMLLEGTLKEAFFKNGEYTDVLMYAVINKYNNGRNTGK